MRFVSRSQANHGIQRTISSDPVRSAQTPLNGYRRYPAPGPSRRSVWWLIAAYCVLLLANVAHQGGLG